MTYFDAIDYLYRAVPMFHHVGQAAYKEGLSNTLALDKQLKHPHTRFKTIHVGGTNGKGSTSHTLAAILQTAGYKVGLYTSPHLVDFRERIRINGAPMSEQAVVQFIERHRPFFEPLQPSFFELTTAMAFDYFASQEVDVAVIEVGLGGRLDCTNILAPDLCVITNISLDHTAYLGNTLELIAIEKAGIIKSETPVVIGEASGAVKSVFKERAAALHAPLLFAQENPEVVALLGTTSQGVIYQTNSFGELVSELSGSCQLHNANTILTAVAQLHRLGYRLSADDIRIGFANVCQLTGLRGRWQTIGTDPLIICDTGHNVAGITYLVSQIKQQTYQQLHFVFGVVDDKDVTQILQLLPTKATYYFTQAAIPRALAAQKLQLLGTQQGLKGNAYSSVKEAVEAAKSAASPNDFIFIGGSTFVVGEIP